MKSLRLVLVTMFVLAFASAAFAWPSCSGNWVQVPSGTNNTNGAIYVTGDHITFQCQQPKQNHTCQGGHNCNKGGGDPTSTSTSTSSSTATGGNSSSTATGGTAVSGSQSGVSNSGNSSNTNTNTAQGGAGGSASSNQTQSQSNSSTNNNASSASDNGNGNGNNSNNSTTNIAAPKIPVNTAYAPTSLPTANCFKGYGAGVQTMPVGVSLGGGKIDENCRALETARNAPNRLTFCKVYVKLKDAKAAGVTLDDCMGRDPKEEAALPVPAPIQPQVVVVPIQTAAPVPAVVPAVVASNPPVVEEIIPVGICTFASKTQCTPAGSDAYITDPARPTSVCKEMIGAAVAALARHPGYVIVLRGNRNSSEDKLLAVSRANNVKKQFEAQGVKSSQIKTEAGIGTSRTVQITLEPVR